MPLRDGFFSTATQTSCCNRIQRSNRVRLLVVSTHDFPDILYRVGTHQIRQRRRAARSSTSQGRAEPPCARIIGLNREVSEGKADV